MNTKRQYQFGAMLSYATIILNILTSIFFVPFVLRMVGTDQQGIYSTIGSVVNYIAMADLGLGNAVIRYVAKYRAENKLRDMESFLGMVMGIYLAIGAVVLCIGLVCYANLQNYFVQYTPEMLAIAKPMFLLLLFNATLSMTLSIFPAVLAGYEQFVFPRVVSIARLALRVILLPILLLCGGDVLTIAILDTALSVATTLVQFLYCFLRLRVRIRFGRPNIPLLKEIARYSVFIFLNVIMEQLYWNTDALIIGRFYLPGVVLISTYGTQIAQYFIQFSGALSNLFLPKATQMAVHSESRETMTDMMIRFGRIQLMICALIAIGFTLVGHQFFVCWLGDEMGLAAVTQSYVIALMLIWALLVPMFENTGIAIVQALNRHAFRSVVLCGIALLNVVVSIVLVQFWGPVGAAIGTAGALIIGNVGIINWYYYKMIGLNIPRFFREVLHGILPAMLLSGGLGALTFFMPQEGWLMLGARVLVICIIYLPLMYRIGMNDTERGQLWALLKRRKHREETSA